MNNLEKVLEESLDYKQRLKTRILTLYEQIKVDTNPELAVEFQGSMLTYRLLYSEVDTGKYLRWNYIRLKKL